MSDCLLVVATFSTIAPAQALEAVFQAVAPSAQHNAPPRAYSSPDLGADTFRSRWGKKFPVGSREEPYPMKQTPQRAGATPAATPTPNLATPQASQEAPCGCKHGLCTPSHVHFRLAAWLRAVIMMASSTPASPHATCCCVAVRCHLPLCFLFWLLEPTPHNAAAAALLMQTRLAQMMAVGGGGGYGGGGGGMGGWGSSTCGGAGGAGELGF